MTNKEAIEKYSKDMPFVAEQIMYFLLQEYWEELHEKGYVKESHSPVNGVSFVKKFLKEETIVETDALDRYTVRDSVIEIEEGSWREVTEPIVADTHDVEFDVIKDPKIHSGRTNGDNYMECFDDAKYEFLGVGDGAYVEITFADGTSRTVPMSWWNAPCGSH